MYNKKYELVMDDTININNHTLYRIKALRDFNDVINDDIHIGDLGGYIESEDNLSHEGDCWIYDNAKVYGNAKVFGRARVFNNAKIYGNALISGNAKVFDNARVRGIAEIS